MKSLDSLRFQEHLVATAFVAANDSAFLSGRQTVVSINLRPISRSPISRILLSSVCRNFLESFRSDMDDSRASVSIEPRRLPRTLPGP